MEDVVDKLPCLVERHFHDDDDDDDDDGCSYFPNQSVILGFVVSHLRNLICFKTIWVLEPNEM